MRPVSNRFLTTVTGSHTAVFQARVVAPGQTGVNPAGTDVAIESGDVRLDSGQAIRSTLDLEVDGTGLWPKGASSLLVPYGNEVFVRRGVAYGGASVEWVSLGYHRINDVEQDDPPNGPIRIAATDRMSNILDATLTEVVQFTPTDTYGNVVEQLVSDAYAAAMIEWDDTEVAGQPLGRSVIADSDRYKFLDELIVSLGKVWYFDHRGVLLIRTPPQPGHPLWTVARGAGGVLLSVSRSLGRAGVYNGVVAAGEALDTTPPARGLAVDADTTSPTRWGGPFGKVPREYASPLLKTDEQARLAAATILRKSLGLPYNVDLSAVPNPALEPDDPIVVGIEGTPQVVEPAMVTGDSFSRTVVDAPGTSESGHAWSGSGSQYQVNDGALKLNMSANTVAAPLESVAAGRRNTDAYLDARLPATAAGNNLITGIVLRYLDSNNYLMCRLDWTPTGWVSLRLAEWRAGVFTQLDELVSFASYSAGAWWTLRAQSDEQLIRMQAWRRDAPQPGCSSTGCPTPAPACAAGCTRGGRPATPTPARRSSWTTSAPSRCPSGRYAAARCTSSTR